MDKASKNQVKKMMEDHIRITSVTREIDSPYAKYNNQGQLMCIVCGSYVKSKIIWNAHINKTSHKENVAKLKEKQAKINSVQDSKEGIQENASLGNRKSTVKTDSIKKLCTEKPKGILKNASKPASSNEGGELEEKKAKIVDPSPVKEELPPGFIDPSVCDADVTEPKDVKNESQKTTATKEVLPEGFFDDPVADAKARNVEYHDKEAEEWLAFLKEVSAAEMVSQQIIAEDKEEAALDTQIEQANEQIRCWERVVELDQAKTTHLQDATSSRRHSDSGDSSEEEFSPVIWRTKNSLI